ncbi:unnamed protein product [Angiostrongylus costaricensis]|uniref:Btz domain-containing protein n=1 Tax=Angiostrongylus costaricensis TaxID=334426 RepID=A0A0R3PL82_ANGCS|nr:unnamed protein product [Angiostrongylus costaricensis]
MEFRPEYDRPPREFYQNVDYPDYHDYRDLEHRSNEFLNYARNEYPQQRARSYTRLDPEFIPSEFHNSGRPLEKSLRSKSLDYRDGFREEPQFFDDRRGVSIPIHRDRNERNYNYERDIYTPFMRNEDKRNGQFDTAARNGSYPRESNIQMKRVPRVLTRSNEWLPRRNNDDRSRNPRDLFKTEGYSPKSASSSKRHNLNISIDPVRSRRDYGRSDEYTGYGRDNGREMYREDGRYVDGNVRGSAAKYQAQSNYNYESHGGGGGSGGGGFESPPRRIPITQQSHDVRPGTPPDFFRPIRHHRIMCCCFDFTWPPWSYEPTAPPQPLYRNI